MAFRTYKNLGEVLKKHQISYLEVPFPAQANNVKAPVTLHEELTFTQREIPYSQSEAAICEAIIFPILREVWKQFVDTFAIWSHQPIEYNEELTGIPDYIFARKSALGKIIFDTPYVAVVEAKRDDFTMGWAQCGLEMYTIQQLNNDTRPVFGIVSNGDVWEVAQLDNTTFINYTAQFTLSRLDELFGALTYVLDVCKRVYNL